MNAGAGGCAHYFRELEVEGDITSGVCCKCGARHNWPSAAPNQYGSGYYGPLVKRLQRKNKMEDKKVLTLKQKGLIV